MEPSAAFGNIFNIRVRRVVLPCLWTKRLKIIFEQRKMWLLKLRCMLCLFNILTSNYLQEALNAAEVPRASARGHYATEWLHFFWLFVRRSNLPACKQTRKTSHTSCSLDYNVFVLDFRQNWNNAEDRQKVVTAVWDNTGTTMSWYMLCVC